jgi:hypothetical protein
LKFVGWLVFLASADVLNVGKNFEDIRILILCH